MILPNPICTATLIHNTIIFSLFFAGFLKRYFLVDSSAKTNFLAESQNGGRRGTTKPSTKGGECLFLALYNTVQWVGILSEAFLVFIFYVAGFLHDIYEILYESIQKVPALLRGFWDFKKNQRYAKFAF